MELNRAPPTIHHPRGGGGLRARATQPRTFANRGEVLSPALCAQAKPGTFKKRPLTAINVNGRQLRSLTQSKVVRRLTNAGKCSTRMQTNLSIVLPKKLRFGQQLRKSQRPKIFLDATFSRQSQGNTQISRQSQGSR